MAGEDLERDHRLRPAHARQLDELARHDVGEHLVPRDAPDGDEVPLAGHRVRLGHPVEVGEPAAERLQRVALGLDEHDRRGHVEWVSPGSRTTTSPAPAFCTSDLNAAASVSIGGNEAMWTWMNVSTPRHPAASPTTKRPLPLSPASRMIVTSMRPS